MSPARPQGRGEHRGLLWKSQKSETAIRREGGFFFFKSRLGTPSAKARAAQGGGTRCPGAAAGLVWRSLSSFPPRWLQRPRTDRSDNLPPRRSACPDTVPTVPGQPLLGNGGGHGTFSATSSRSRVFPSAAWALPRPALFFPSRFRTVVAPFRRPCRTSALFSAGEHGVPDGPGRRPPNGVLVPKAAVLPGKKGASRPPRGQGPRAGVTVLPHPPALGNCQGPGSARVVELGREPRRAHGRQKERLPRKRIKLGERVSRGVRGPVCSFLAQIFKTPAQACAAGAPGDWNRPQWLGLRHPLSAH